MIEKWESSVRKYEKRKAETCEQLKLTVESMLLHELENQLVLNKKRLSTFNAQKAAIEGIIDARIGVNIKEVVTG